MSAAHELIDRGFEVVVLERRSIAGGKARSVPVSDGNAASGGHELADTGLTSLEHQLPGEHGFRFFPGFYRHIVDTMGRIPSWDGRPVGEHLVPATRITITQYGKPALVLPANFPASPSDLGLVFRDLLMAFGPVTDLTPEDLAYFGARIWQILTSCPERRLAEYEAVSWWDFVGAEQRSLAYQKFLAAGITRSLVAAKARTASTRTIGDIFVQLLVPMLEPWGGPVDRVLDGPTNFAWIDPWLSYLRSRGVHYIFDAEVQEILSDSTAITGVVIKQNGLSQVLRGDHYIAALPIERIAPMVTPSLLQIDPFLRNLPSLAKNVEWMNGVQYYLTRELPNDHGHVIHIDTAWALTSISQLSFWPNLPAGFFGNSQVRGVLSVDVSDWTLPGSKGLPAMRCSREEVVKETWLQLKRSINIGAEILRDDDLHSWFLDSDIQPDSARPGWLKNSEPLLVNLVNTWQMRPEAITSIPNLFLASDYVRTHTDLATMEGANEAARRAVNGILDSTGYIGSRCMLWPLSQPALVLPFQAQDALRYQAGLPWDCSGIDLLLPALRVASPLLKQVADLLQGIGPFLSPGAETAPLARGGVASDDGQGEGPQGFQQRLSWYAGLVAETLDSGIPDREPRRPLYNPIRAFVRRSGKGLRPALCMATARALGGDPAEALPAAAGIEMLHNAFLVHDDIEDESDSRRGAPTMHRSLGLPLAVNAGDAMNALAMGLFRRCAELSPPDLLPRLLDEVDHMLLESLEGQAMELGWMRDHSLDVGPEDYLRLVLKKTAWYSFIHPLRIGALVANPGDRDLDRFDRFGYFLGLAFQIADDVLNLRGSFARYGKEIDGDLWEGKRTLILSHALATAPDRDRSWMAGFLARPRQRRLPREIFRLHDLLESNGSIDWAQQVATSFHEAALREFDTRAFASVTPGPDLAWLRSCVGYLAQRDS